jgi:hypothetical protein
MRASRDVEGVLDLRWRRAEDVLREAAFTKWPPTSSEVWVWADEDRVVVLDAGRTTGASPPAEAKLEAMAERVRKLEARVSELEERLGLAEDEGDDEQDVPLSPHARWIESHLDELRALPDTWIVIDAEKGIVFQTKDEAEFDAQLAKYPPEDRHRLMPLSTRTYT